jgi:hypothetical protein
LIIKAFLFKDFIQDNRLQSYDKQQHQKATDDENLARRTTFRKLGALGKLYNIVVHLRASSHRTTDFKLLAERLLPIDNATRWNSWFFIICVTLKLESAIKAYIKKHLDTLKEDYLSPQDWDILRTMKIFLEPFKSATLVAQGDSGLLHESILNLDILKRHISRYLVRRKSERKSEFHKRYENALTILD